MVFVVERVFLGVKVSYPCLMDDDEVLGYVKGELLLKKGYRLVAMDVVLDGDDVVLSPHYDSVKRVRRVTGYLGDVKRLSDAKVFEVGMRQTQF